MARLGTLVFGFAFFALVLAGVAYYMENQVEAGREMGETLQDVLDARGDQAAPEARESARRMLATLGVGGNDASDENAAPAQALQISDRTGLLAPLVKPAKHTEIQVKRMEFEALGDYSEGLRRVYRSTEHGSRWGYIDIDGTVVIPLDLESAGDFHENLARARRGGKWGFIDKTGQFVIPPRFDEAGDFQNGRARVRLKNKTHDIDSMGRTIEPLPVEPKKSEPAPKAAAEETEAETPLLLPLDNR